MKNMGTQIPNFEIGFQKRFCRMNAILGRLVDTYEDTSKTNCYGLLPKTKETPPLSVKFQTNVWLWHHRIGVASLRYLARGDRSARLHATSWCTTRTRGHEHAAEWTRYSGGTTGDSPSLRNDRRESCTTPSTPSSTTEESTNISGEDTDKEGSAPRHGSIHLNA